MNETRNPERHGDDWVRDDRAAGPDGPSDWEHHDPAVAPHPASVHADGRESADRGAANHHGHPRGANGAVEARVARPAGGSALFSDEERRRLHARWNELEGGFIDDPRHSVTEADRLVRDTIGSLHDLFERDRVQLEAVWSRGEEVSTEDLRLTLQRYRAFFDRLLSV